MCCVNSDLCHLQHKLIGCITEMKSVYSAVRTGPLNKAVCAPSLKGERYYEGLKEKHCNTRSLEGATELFRKASNAMMMMIMPL
jgi:hypothetical protein